MSTTDPAGLLSKTCVPCEGGVPKLTEAEARGLLEGVPGWEISGDGLRISRRWVTKGFDAAVAFFNEVAALAGRENHHPDLHLEGYRNARIEVTTHAIGGLSENDFILAAKINQIPVAVKGAKGGG